MLVFPDPVTDPAMISGATFLFFRRPIVFTLPPQVVTEEAYSFPDIVRQRGPAWGDTFLGMVKVWLAEREAWRSTSEVLKPLQGSAFKAAWLVYPASREALADAWMLASSANLDIKQLWKIINPACAAGEIVRHIMLEGYLQCDRNLDALYLYCDDLFRSESTERLLVEGYLLRCGILVNSPPTPILLTNERLPRFLSALPVQILADSEPEIDDDVIAWELFRQILSPRLDPLNAERAKLVAKLIRTRRGEIERLKSRCLSLADRVKRPRTLEQLKEHAERVIRSEVQAEVADLLDLNKQTIALFFTKLFSDRATWLATYTAIAGIALNEVVTLGGAIGALASVSAGGFRSVVERHQRLKRSDFSIVYRVASRPGRK